MTVLEFKKKYRKDSHVQYVARGELEMILVKESIGGQSQYVYTAKQEKEMLKYFDLEVRDGALYKKVKNI